MSSYIDLGYLGKTFNAWVGGTQALFSSVAGGAWRRTELLAGAVSGSSSIFSREIWMPASRLPEPSLASVASVMGVSAAGFFAVSALNAKIESDAHPSFIMRKSLPSIMISVGLGLLALVKCKPFGLKTGGIAFEGGVAKGLIYGLGSYLLIKLAKSILISVAYKYLPIKIWARFFLIDTRRSTDIFNITMLKRYFSVAMEKPLYSAAAYLSTIGLAVAASQILGYLSNKLGSSLGLITVSALIALFYHWKDEYEDNGVLNYFIYNFTNALCIGLCYQASGNFLALSLYQLFFMIDLFSADERFRQIRLNN